MKRERSPGVKLALAGLVAMLLIVPLMMVYALVYDRENQSSQAQAQVTQGWGGAQTVTGPVLVLPYTYRTSESETTNGQQVQRTRTQRGELYISPTRQSLETTIDPDRRRYAIYESVVFESAMQGTARFDAPGDLDRLGVDIVELLPAQAELRFGVSDPRGLTQGARVTVNGTAAQLEPGSGPAATNGAGFSTAIAWDGAAPLEVTWQYGLRGSHSLSLVPRGGETSWHVSSPWPHPSFTGSYPPNDRSVSGEGFEATYSGITNLSLNEALVNTVDSAPPAITGSMDYPEAQIATGGTATASIGLVDPVDLYSQVDRAVKYGFLFIGLTFAMFLMFDIVGGARVASAEYLLTGAGLVLFFVMLLAFAEVWGFVAAYLTASAAIIGLLTAYSAAVLGTWKRAFFVGAMLAGLYALLYVLLNLETYSLVIGSLLLFFTLAGIMYATRRVDWSGLSGRYDENDGAGQGGIPA
ncbi:MAG: cell envelope integrity protein CreD [Erythrobacter sp.]|nr:cell envelope integrity protein CreD [Erythrobacter sp.]